MYLCVTWATRSVVVVLVVMMVVLRVMTTNLGRVSTARGPNRTTLLRLDSVGRQFSVDHIVEPVIAKIELQRLLAHLDLQLGLCFTLAFLRKLVHTILRPVVQGDTQTHRYRFAIIWVLFGERERK